MLYLDTPIGVGFSYSTGASSNETVNDEITGKQSKALYFSTTFFFSFFSIEIKSLSCVSYVLSDNLFYLNAL